MPVQIQCPFCGQAYALTDEQAPQYAGQTISCTRCARSFIVPPIAGAFAPSMPPPLPGAGEIVPTTLTGAPELLGDAPKYVPVPLRPMGPEPRWALPPDMPNPAMGPTAGLPTAGAPTSGLAIASLVCAIVGACVPIIPSLIAIVLGILALRRTVRDPQRVSGRGMAIAGIVIAILVMGANLALIAKYALPEWRRAMAETEKTLCAERLRGVGNALIAYAQEHNGAFPERLDQLSATNSFRPDDLYCPAAISSGGKSTAYLYAGAGLTTASPPECVLLYEPLEHHDYTGVNVLFADGRVTFIGQIEAGKAVPKLRKGTNPPWTGSEAYTPPAPPPPASQAATQPTEPPAPPAPNITPY